MVEQMAHLVAEQKPQPPSALSAVPSACDPAAGEGLRLREGMTFNEWVTLGRRLAQLSHASAWYLGDWLRYGERSYGRRYKTALATTCFDYQTLRNYAWVAGRFAPARRLTGVSFQHHAEVAALPEPEQDLWLRRAQRHNWSRNELRRQLKRAASAGLDEDRPRLVVQIQVPADRGRRWQAAADAASQDLTEWLTQAADDAARRALLEPPRVAGELSAVVAAD
jgi:hypothetical protein